MRKKLSLLFVICAVMTPKEKSPAIAAAVAFEDGSRVTFEDPVWYPNAQVRITVRNATSLTLNVSFHFSERLRCRDSMDNFETILLANDVPAKTAVFGWAPIQGRYTGCLVPRYVELQALDGSSTRYEWKDGEALKIGRAIVGAGAKLQP